MRGGGGGITEVNEMQILLVVYTKKTLNTSTRQERIKEWPQQVFLERPDRPMSAGRPVQTNTSGLRSGWGSSTHHHHHHHHRHVCMRRSHEFRFGTSQISACVTPVCGEGWNQNHDHHHYKSCVTIQQEIGLIYNICISGPRVVFGGVSPCSACSCGGVGGWGGRVERNSFYRCRRAGSLNPAEGCSLSLSLRPILSSSSAFPLPLHDPSSSPPLLDCISAFVLHTSPRSMSSRRLTSRLKRIHRAGVG